MTEFVSVGPLYDLVVDAENTAKAPVATARATRCAPQLLALLAPSGASFVELRPRDCPFESHPAQHRTAPRPLLAPPQPRGSLLAVSLLATEVFASLTPRTVRRVHRKSEISEQPALRAGDLALGFACAVAPAHRSAPSLDECVSSPADEITFRRRIGSVYGRPGVPPGMPEPKSRFDETYPCDFYTPAELFEPDRMYTVPEIGRLLQDLGPDADLDDDTEAVLIDWAVPWVLVHADDLVIGEPLTENGPGYYGVAPHAVEGTDGDE